MTFADETVVDQGVATPEAQEVNQNSVSQEQEVAPETNQDRNFRQLRESNEELKREITSLRIRPAEAPVVQETTSFPDWKSVEGEDLLTKTQTVGAIKDAVKEALQERDFKESPALIESQYKDYSQVMTPENIDRLEKNNPRLAASLTKIKDPYARGSLAYSYMKSTGIYKEGFDANTKQRALDNSKKPLPVSAANTSNALESASAYAKGLTPEMKKHLYQEMLQSRKG